MSDNREELSQSQLSEKDGLSKTDGAETEQESERMKKFHARKEKEYRRRKRNKIIGVTAAALVLLGAAAFGVSRIHPEYFSRIGGVFAQNEKKQSVLSEKGGVQDEEGTGSETLTAEVQNAQSGETQDALAGETQDMQMSETQNALAGETSDAQSGETQDALAGETQNTQASETPDAHTDEAQETPAAETQDGQEEVQKVLTAGLQETSKANAAETTSLSVMILEERPDQTDSSDSILSQKETSSEDSEKKNSPKDSESETETEEESRQLYDDPREDVWNHYQNMVIAANTDSYVNIRNQPTTDGTIIGKLVKYAGGELLEDMGNGWLHISSGGIDGYVASQYCVSGEEAKELALEHCYAMVEITADKLNVRSGPGEEYETFTQLTASEKQVVEERDGDWLKIAINSSYGYINAAYTVEGYYLAEAMPWSSLSNCSERRQALFAYAEQFIGTKYVYGGNDLLNGIDCSAYVKQCFQNALGISLPRTSREQVNCGTAITLAEAKPGDLLFYADPLDGVIDHVAMYLGDGKILHAAQSLGQVIISKYNYSTEPVAVRNIIGD